LLRVGVASLIQISSTGGILSLHDAQHRRIGASSGHSRQYNVQF
jgi:hypothetical protein